MKNKLIWANVYLSIMVLVSFFITYAFIGEDIMQLSQENTVLKRKIENAERTIHNENN